jgi:hypothetical protein
MKKWKDLWNIIKAKVLTDKNIDKLAERLKKLKAKGLTADQYKSGEIVIGTAAFIVMVVVLPFVGWVSRGGLITRSIPVTVSIEQKNSTNCTNIVTVSGQRVEVSGSGGVSVPLTGGGK